MGVVLHHVLNCFDLCFFVLYYYDFFNLLMYCFYSCKKAYA